MSSCFLAAFTLHWELTHWSKRNSQLPGDQNKTHFPFLEKPERRTWVETERRKTFK